MRDNVFWIIVNVVVGAVVGKRFLKEVKCFSLEIRNLFTFQRTKSNKYFIDCCSSKNWNLLRY